jgi:hypothetical protein
MSLDQYSSVPIRGTCRHPLPVGFLIYIVAVGLSFGAAEKQEAGSPTGTSPAPAKAIFEPAHKTTFAEVTSQLDPGGSVYAYLATEQWLAGLGTNLSGIRDLIKSLPDIGAADSQQFDQVFGLVASGIHDSGLEQLTGVGVSSVEIAPGLYRSKVILHHRQGGGDGLLWNMPGRQAHPLLALDMLPQNTAVAAIGDVDITAGWKAVERCLSDSNLPDAARGLREWQSGFEQGTKLSWTNLLASLGGEVGVILTLDGSRKVSVPMGAQSIELPEPGLIVLMKITNDTLYNRLSQELKGNPETVVTDEPGLKMCALPIPLPLPVQLQATVASSGDYFFAASSPDLVRAVLDSRRGGKPGIAKSAEFKALLQHLPSEGNHFFYTSKSFSEALRGIQKQALNTADKAPTHMAFLQQWLQGKEAAFGLAVGGRTATGWQLVSVGNKDTSAAMVLAPALAGVAMPAAMLLPALAKSKSRAQSIVCVNNLKQIGLAFRIWSLDHGDQFPFNVSTSNGGTLELCARGEDGFDLNSFRHFQVMSNELSTPKILICPADPSKQLASNFSNLQGNNVSYRVRTGANITELSPQEVLVHCPVHGHDALCDGSVQQGNMK